jgi:hypothetical protein
MKEPRATAPPWGRWVVLGDDPMTNDEKLIKDKLGLIGLASELENVSRACKVLGYF